MEELIRIDLPVTKYTFATEALLYKVKITEFEKLLRTIGEQADPTVKSAQAYYNEISALIYEAMPTPDADRVYEYEVVDNRPGSEASKMKVKVNVRKHLDDMLKKIQAAERKYRR